MSIVTIREYYHWNNNVLFTIKRQNNIKWLHIPTKCYYIIIDV